MKNKRRFLSLLLWAVAAVLPAQVRAVTPPAIYNLGTLGGSASGGNALNASGQVTGYSYAPNGDIHAFRYTGTPGSGGTMADLGTLGGSTIEGYGINGAGQVAGA